MRSTRITEAYDRIQPSAQTYASILERVKAQAAEPVQERRNRHSARWTLILAAAVVLIAALSGLALAWQKWSLPKPTYYEPVPGNTLVHESQEYDQSRLTIPAAQTQTPDTDAVRPEPEPEPEPEEKPLDDAWFIAKVQEVLALVGLEDVQSDRLRVDRQTDFKWGREEAQVYFLDDAIRTTVTFRADTGELLEIFSIDYLPQGESCQNDAEAEALARSYYERLPVQQGYEIAYVEKYDDQYWSYDFCRKVGEELYNEYECVRLAVNPVTGRMTGLVVFDVPLLDDHAPGDVALTQEEAEAVLINLGRTEPGEWTLIDAREKVVLPNWWFVETKPGMDMQASRVSRLAWVLRYQKQGEIFVTEHEFWIDLYTGELLGGGTIG